MNELARRALSVAFVSSLMAACDNGSASAPLAPAPAAGAGSTAAPVTPATANDPPPQASTAREPSGGDIGAPDPPETGGGEKPAMPKPDAPEPDAPEPDAPKPEAPADQTTYTGHVRPILARACVSCHSDGAIAPFSLDTYERAKTFAPLMAEATKSRRMPPSVIDNSGDCNRFPEVPWLSDEEIATLERWSQQGALEGDASVVPPMPRVLPKLTDQIKTIATPSYAPSKAQPDDWRCFLVTSPFGERAFVTGSDTRPGDKETAHHAVVFYPMDDFSAGLAQVLDDAEEGPGYTCFGSPGVPASILMAWAPGDGAMIYPKGLGLPVDAGRPMIIQMHYNTVATAQPMAAVTEIDLQFATQGVAPAAFVQVLDLEMALPPGKADAEEIIETTVENRRPDMPDKLQLYGVFPHMHELGRSLKLTIQRSGAAEECVLDAPRYDFFWQRMYFFDEPIELHRTDLLKLRCQFDTTKRTAVTNWGESTQDEMCVVGMFVKL